MADKNQGYDFVYLKNTVGAPLAEALAQMALEQPEDPIDYVGNYLLKFVANERQRTERMIQSRVRKSEVDAAAEAARKKKEVADKAKEALDQAILADNATRELLLNTTDFDVLCKTAIDKIALATHAEACYLGRRVADAEGLNYIQWFAATPSSQCVLERFVAEETGLTFDVMKEIEADPDAPPDADGNPPPPAIPPFVHVENVIREPRIQYFGIPRMGAYLAKGIKYKSYLHGEVAQGDGMPPIESWLVVAVDTLGQARPFTADEIRDFVTWSLTTAEAVELYEKRAAIAQIELRKVDERNVKAKLDAIKETLQANATSVASSIETIEDEAQKSIQEATMKAQLATELLISHLEALHAVGTSLIPFRAPILKTLASGLVLLGGATKAQVINTATKMPSWDKIRLLLGVDGPIARSIQAFQLESLDPSRVAAAKELFGEEPAAEDVELPAPVVLVLHSWIQTVCSSSEALASAKAAQEEQGE
ncbi:hypothetical protein AeMF1_019694 [Aphanomyces euteiches]|nr:hypothetical protein AeMF1_019694 [Aphanomyces euteiches]KAH9189299.1 hypothetical protein AeNC1_008724 [Aphanomyces euteiches]